MIMYDSLQTHTQKNPKIDFLISKTFRSSKYQIDDKEDEKAVNKYSWHPDEKVLIHVPFLSIYAWYFGRKQ